MLGFLVYFTLLYSSSIWSSSRFLSASLCSASISLGVGLPLPIVGSEIMQRLLIFFPLNLNFKSDTLVDVPLNVSVLCGMSRSPRGRGYFVREIVAPHSLGADVLVAASGKDDWLQLYAVFY